jgi:hypothetical protein
MSDAGERGILGACRPVQALHFLRRFRVELFNILPGFQKSPAGLERRILRTLPRLLWQGTALLALVAVAVQFWPWSGHEAQVFTRTTTLHIWLFSLVVLHWTMVLTVAIGAFIVMVMKGPAYVADAYPLEDADQPSPGQPRR